MCLKNGEERQYDARCPFDCTKWDECVCENTARAGIADGFIGFTSSEIADIQDAARSQ